MKKEYNIKKLKKAEPKYLKNLKESITMRLEPDVIRYFKSLSLKTGIPYQTLINYVLKDYSIHRLRPSANWPLYKESKN
jgi:predicted DNA binding CopG/RHH family protein